MNFIANILTNRKFNGFEFYNIVSKKENLIPGIPTLVIGWGFTKELYPEANIICWEIDNDTFWTYGNREHHDRYDKALIKFKDLAIKRFIRNIKYKFFNMVIMDKDAPTPLDILLDNYDNLKIYVNNDIIYITSDIEQNGGKWVYGFSLRDCDYIGINRKDIFKKIYSNNNIFIDNKEILNTPIREFFRNCNYVIPCLF